MLKESYPYYLASEPEYANTDLEVTNKYTGEVATKVAMADADTIDKAIAAAQQAQPAMAALAPYERRLQVGVLNQSFLRDLCHSLATPHPPLEVDKNCYCRI